MTGSSLPERPLRRTKPTKLKIKVPWLLEAEGEGAVSVVAMVVVVALLAGVCAFGRLPF
jgi:hypothetical protein